MFRCLYPLTSYSMKTNEPSKTDQEIAREAAKEIYNWHFNFQRPQERDIERIILAHLTKSKRVSPQEEKTLAKAETPRAQGPSPATDERQPEL